jgi:predicted RNA-binding protein with PIN domain
VVQVPLVVPDEVRQRLVELAATAIGAWPESDIPRPLRQIARFTPAKRARQGAGPLWAEIAGNEEFRRGLAELSETAMPELAAQVAENTVPDDADRIMVGALRYLLRPSGWDEGLAGLAKELSAEREQRDLEGELSRMSTELAKARSSMRELTDARDRALAEVSAAASRAEDDVVRLKKELRALKGALSRAEKSAADAESRLAQVEADMAKAEAEAVTEARRSASRIATLEAELDTIRRTGRAARDYDEVRLWLLLEQLSQAADGLRGMGLARDPGMRPADAVVDAPEAEAARMSVLDASALDRLLHGQYVHLIIDGYNLTKSAWPDLALTDQRARLTTAARALSQRRGIEVTVVFDGQGAAIAPGPGSGPARHFRVRFSAKDQIADDLIRELLSLEPPGRTVVVASSDKEVAASVRSMRAWSVPADTMLERLSRG